MIAQPQRSVCVTDRKWLGWAGLLQWVAGAGPGLAGLVLGWVAGWGLICVRQALLGGGHAFRHKTNFWEFLSFCEQNGPMELDADWPRKFQDPPDRNLGQKTWVGDMGEGGLEGTSEDSLEPPCSLGEFSSCSVQRQT